MGVGVGFTIFFGGSIADTGAAIVVGLFLVAFVSAGQDLKFHPFIQDIFAGFGVAFACCLLKEGLGDQMNMDTVMIGSFMPLVPGMAITNAVRDTLRGDYPVSYTHLDVYKRQRVRRTFDMLEVDKKTFEDEVLKAEGYVFVDFFGDGCVPCQALMPFVHEMADKYGDKILSLIHI